jgi:hypothetical protein
VGIAQRRTAVGGGVRGHSSAHRVGLHLGMAGEHVCCHNKLEIASGALGEGCAERAPQVAAADARFVSRLLTSRESVLTGVPQMRMTKNLGMLLLGIWLIITGLIPLLNLGVSGLGTLMAVLAVAAGALILVGR